MDTVVTWSGEVDLATAPALTRDLHKTLEGPGVSRVVLDLSAVSAMDSTGLTAVLQSAQEAKARAIEFVLRGVTEPVAHLLKVTGLDPFLRFE